MHLGKPLSAKSADFRHLHKNNILSNEISFLNMLYCPANISIHDIWINHGVSTCFLETVTSSIVSLFILIFGLAQLVFYKRYSTPIEDLPWNKLYSLQVLSHICLIVIAGLDILLRHLLWHRQVLGYEVLYVVSSFITWPMLLWVLIVERSYQLPTPPSHGHGFVPLMTWTAAFIAENLAFLSMDNEEWWYHLSTAENKTAFAFWMLRYVFTVIAFILGIKAPGIRQEYNNRSRLATIEDEENTRTESSERSQGSTWLKAWKKITTLLPYMWPKNSIGLQLRVIICILLLIGVRVTNVFVPIFSKKIIDALTQKTFAWDLVLAFVGLKLIQGGATGSQGILNILRSFFWIKVSQYTKREIQVGLFRHLHSLSLRWHLSRKTGMFEVLDFEMEIFEGLKIPIFNFQVKFCASWIAEQSPLMGC